MSEYETLVQKHLLSCQNVTFTDDTNVIRNCLYIRLNVISEAYRYHTVLVADL